MSIVQFTKAQREGTHVIIGIFGESGCGKTMSAILMARGLVGPQGRVAFLDTETGRGKMYAHLAGGYDYAELTPPFTPERYTESVKAAEDAGYDALIIDSGSAEWEGIGGILESAENGRSANGSPLSGLIKWAKPKAAHKRYVQSLLTTRMHLIICLRAKERMEQKGNTVVSTGYVSVQDKRFIYETTVLLFLPNEGNRGIPRLDKCPEDLLGAFPAGKRISLETGAKIAEWVHGGAPVDQAFLALKREAEETAEKGSAMMRDWWGKLTKAQQQNLKAHLPNLQSIARVADEEIAAAQSKPTTFSPASTDQPTNEVPPDPFGAEQETVRTEELGETIMAEDTAREVADEIDELRDEYLPVQIEALKQHASMADISEHDTLVKAALKDRPELVGIWNGARLERERVLSKSKTAARA